jgi:UDP-glucose 4-epimerase
MSGSDSMIPGPHGSGVAFVTGAAGFLGGAVAAALAGAGWRVIGCDLMPGDAAACAHWIAGEVHRDALARATADIGAPEVVFHAAGGSSVGASVADPETDFARTVGSLRETLVFMGEHAPRARLIYPSSAAVYGAASPGAPGEDASARPISPYGRHKLQAEAEIAASGLEAVILRFFSLYGPGLRKQLLWDLARRLTAEPVRLELSGTGEEKRDFLYLDDAVRLVGMAAGLGVSGAPLILNGGAGEAVGVRRAAETLARALGSHAAIGFSGETRTGDPAALVADVSKARALGFAPRTSFEDGVEAYARWFKDLPA